ncbi:hypothetical protein FACS1894172_14620 [Spirochaetia bacterium]|nr:hypothetical protein FACS1894164_01430 [Spirochaetia bacterium]GHU34402.1 hypothetical protein FACS1894172_14620 [Spirochaetia bacterium]
MKRNLRLFRFPLGGLCLVAIAAIFGTVTMYLWNALLPSIFGLPTISWGQAVGLLVLCRVLFGGIVGGLGHLGGGHERIGAFQGRWNAMSDEQRQHLAEEIQKRHGFDPRGDFDRGSWFNSRKQDDADRQENADNKKDE